MFVLGSAAGVMRSRAISSGATRGLQLREGQQNWPGRVQQVSSAFNNQFESPTYFLAVLAFAMIADVTDPILVTLAWVYIASRLAHAFIYVTFNHVPTRFLVFLAGFIAMTAMWALVGWRVLAG